jgi:hypothetical protein
MNEWMNESQRLIQDCTNAMEFNLQIISKRHSSHHASSNEWLVAKWRHVCENYVSRIYIKLQFTWQDFLEIQTCSCMTHPSIHPSTCFLNIVMVDLRFFFFLAILTYSKMAWLILFLVGRSQVDSLDWLRPTDNRTDYKSASHRARFLHTPRRYVDTKRGWPPW